MLGKLEELQLVHGDFRSSNILAKRSATNPAVLEDFKLVDFELSGKVNENYPFLH
jgi:tRNA A-37 threonylcarbamoyl transferase component Bud32